MIQKESNSVLKIGFVLALTAIISFSGINQAKAADPEKTVQ